MLRVYACITEQHDLGLVVVAGLICALAAFTALSLQARAAESDRTAVRVRWLTAAAVVTGCGVWSTHFVAMLAFKPDVPVGYDIGLTILSIVTAISATWLGLGLSLWKPRFALEGGAIIGGAVGGMHYVGMAAMRVQADVAWDALYVGASVAIGVTLGAAAMWTATRAPTLRRRMSGAALLVLAIVGLHFTAMAAASLSPDSSIPLPERLIDPSALAMAIAAVTILIVSLGLTGSIVDRHLAERSAAEAKRLRLHIAELETMQVQLEATAAKTGEALEAAEAGNRAKSQFLAAMSHELRTPLNAVIGFADMIGNEPYGPLGSPRYREYIDHIRSSGTHLLRLINDVLEFSKAESGQLGLEESDVDVGAEIKAALDGLGPEAARGTLRLHDDTARDLPLLRADARRVRKILLNLLSNAIKFTPAGGSVRVRAFVRGGGLTLTIADTGIGMKTEDIDTAFESFSQIDSRLSRRYEGAGLGLPLTKQFVTLHGGTIDIDSVPGRGTTVTVVFPHERVIAPLRVVAAA
jgi:signal transduction histidine kinase